MALGAVVTLESAVRALVRGRGVSLHLRALHLLLPALAVCLWYVVMANHSSDHTYFTYRNVTVAVLAVYTFAACVLTPREPEEKP